MHSYGVNASGMTGLFCKEEAMITAVRLTLELSRSLFNLLIMMSYKHRSVLISAILDRVPPPAERGRHAAQQAAHPSQTQYHGSQGQGSHGQYHCSQGQGSQG